MNDFLELALRRQSCRNFDGRPVEHEKLVKCVEAASLAPSACNSQPWSFVVVESPELLPKVAECGQQMGINGFLSKAGAFIIVLEEYAPLSGRLRGLIDSQYFARWDLGGAIEHICLEAETQGLGSCIIGMYDRGRLCELLDIPREKRFASFIALGYAADPTVRPKVRKPLEEIARFV